jgi:two-component system alkaline phosphatase synthesis response regulator PhoP
METVPASAAQPKLSVLVIEDDKFLQKILLTKLSKEGFDVQGASDGEEGLKMAIAGKPTIVLLDLILPKVNGFEVLTEMKTNPKVKNVPVIVLSNLSQDEDKKRADDLGAIDFMVKADLSINDVVTRVKESYAKYLAQSK